MKSWILILGILSFGLLPFSLRANQSPDPDAGKEKDFAPLLGDERFVDSARYFFLGLSNEIEWWSRRVIRRAARYPNSGVCQYWTQRATDDQTFLQNRDDNIRVIAFVGMGVYSEKEFLDQQNSSEFKKLQDRLFKSYIKYLNPAGADVDKLEQDLMVELKDFCTRSSDSFFSQTVLGFLGSASTRMEALINALPSFNEQDWLNAKPPFLNDSNQQFRRLALQFEALQNWFTQRLQTMIKETFSHPRMTELLEDLLSGDDDGWDSRRLLA